MGKAKEYLKQVRKLDTMIEQLIKERDSLRQFDGVLGLSYDGDPVQTSPDGSAPFEKTVARIISLEAELDDLIDEFVATRTKITREIHGLDNMLYVRLLYKRYVEYKSLELIAAEMYYSYDRIRHLHGYALRAFELKYLTERDA